MPHFNSSHLLGHVLQGENDEKISLLDRAVQHISATAKYSVFMAKAATVMMLGKNSSREHFQC
jgi:hypothetical protein